MKINIGCGEDIRQGWVNIDINPLDKSVLKLDVDNEKFPFEDNTVDLIEAIDLLEHLHNLIPFLKECYRVLKHGGALYVEVPKFPSDAAIADPTHVRYFVDETFKYITEYEGARKMYGIDSWKLGELNSTNNRILVRLLK